MNGSSIRTGCSTGTTGGGLETFDSLDSMKDKIVESTSSFGYFSLEKIDLSSLHSSSKAQLESAVRKLLPKSIADKICGSSSRLAHLYGLPKTHKENLSMRPILSATGTYNYALAKWLDEKLKPLSINRFTITDTFAFATEMKETKLNEEDILVSFDVSSLFTNVPLKETITILAKKAFTENWFNETYDLNIKDSDLVTLLQFATKDQLLQFEGNLYQQIDGVAMGSPLGPLMANAFLFSLDEKLERDNKLPYLYRRYVDDTITAMPLRLMNVIPRSASPWR